MNTSKHDVQEIIPLKFTIFPGWQIIIRLQCNLTKGVKTNLRYRVIYTFESSIIVFYYLEFIGKNM